MDCDAIRPCRPDRPRRHRARGPRARIRRHQRHGRDRRHAAGEQPHRHRRRATGKVVVALLRRQPSTSTGSTQTRTARSTSPEAPTGVLREPDAVKWLDDDRFVDRQRGRLEGRLARLHHLRPRRQGRLRERRRLRARDRRDRPLSRRAAPTPRASSPKAWRSPRFGDDRLSLRRSPSAPRWSASTGYRRRRPSCCSCCRRASRPEGAVAIPSRNLLVTANETDLVRGRPRPLARHDLRAAPKAAPAYPTITADGSDGTLLGWGALSGLAADPATPGKLYAVTDSVYGMQPRSSRSTPRRRRRGSPRRSSSPATAQPAQKLDIEGIAADGEGGFWLASEGRTDQLIPHALIHVDAEGRDRRRRSPSPPSCWPARPASASKASRVGAATTSSGSPSSANGATTRRARSSCSPTSPRPRNGAPCATRSTPRRKAAGSAFPRSPRMATSSTSIERDNQIGEAAKVKQIYRVAARRP